jgi:hypothetical protein
MATLLLIVIYLAFIGLGIPDSLFGTAWPAIYTELNLPLSYGSAITITSSLCSVLSSLFSVRLIRRFGTNKVTAFCTALTAIALVGLSFADNFWMLCLLNIPLGLGVKFKVVERVNIGAEWTVRFTTSDKLDVTNKEGLQLNDPYGIKSKGLKNKDTYSWLMLYVSYDMFPKYRKCNN